MDFFRKSLATFEKSFVGNIIRKLSDVSEEFSENVQRELILLENI